MIKIMKDGFNKKLDAIWATAIKKLTEGDYPRICSWDICHLDFERTRLQYPDSNTLPIEKVDYLVRSLTIFLSAWGMYRGSGDLLGRNYRQFGPAVNMILKCKYWKGIVSYSAARELYNGLVSLKLYSDLACQKITSVVFGCNIPLDRMCSVGIKIVNSCCSNFVKPNELDTGFFGDKYDLVSSHRFRNIVIKRNRYLTLKSAKYSNTRKVEIFFFWIGYCSSVLLWIEKALTKGNNNQEATAKRNYRLKTLNKYYSQFCPRGTQTDDKEKLREIQTAIEESFPSEMTLAIKRLGKKNRKKDFSPEEGEY